MCEETHTQFFQQPAELQHAVIHRPFALGHQAPVALLLRAQLGQASRVTGRVGAVFVKTQGDGFEVAGQVLQAIPRGGLKKPLGDQAVQLLLRV